VIMNEITVINPNYFSGFY